MKSVREIAREFMSRGGKQLRPRLCGIVHGALVSGRAPDAPCAGEIGMVREAVECFHKASLIHDDIQDDDEVRYGAPSVHAAYGVPFAIAVGDWLVAEGYRLLATSGFPRAADMLAAASESHLRLSEGQGDELAMRLSGAGRASPAAILSVYRRKTGEAFSLAARLGAIAALSAPGPGSAETERELARFGVNFGVAFQMLDDMADGEQALPAACLDEARAECRRAAAAVPYPALSDALLAFLGA